jgi:glycosyltransferase involved in cell wall biosynthesis
MVHLHSAKAGLVGRLALRGRLATVFQPHAWSWLAASGAVKAGARNWEKRSARWADRIVCVSEEEVRIGRAAGVNARYKVVPNGVDLSDYAEAPPEKRDEARARLGITEGHVVVCVGRLSRQKGQDVLLEAWREVAQAVPGAGLYLVGDGPDRAALESGAPEGVVFAGTRADARDWLAAADVVALPSRWEGMSMVMLEAMATGRPVVASDVAGAAEALSDEAGAVVTPENASALASALITRLKDPQLARAEGRRGRQRAQESHSLDAAARRMERVYRDVLAERG